MPNDPHAGKSGQPTARPASSRPTPSSRTPSSRTPSSRTPSSRTPSSRTLPPSAMDFILTAQIAVAWAGEGGDAPRLGWWRSDLVSEFGGEDLLEQLLPHTWRWAVLQAVRETARRHDAALRAKDHNPDRLRSLFNLGFALDERIEERLQRHKRAHTPPLQALPGLKDVLRDDWSQVAFGEWLAPHDRAATTAAPVGRRITQPLPSSPEAAVSQLLAALLPLGDAYPLPHFRKS